MIGYTEARAHIKSGDLIALTHRSWSSWYDLQVQAVRFFTQSEYSHVAMVWETGGRLFVIESVTPFVRIVPLSLMAEEGFYWVPLNAEITDKELKFALAEVGKGKYSKWQAILSQFRALPIGKDALWECAEFIITSRKLSGVDLGDKATPSAVVQRAQEAGNPVYFIKGLT